MKTLLALQSEIKKLKNKHNAVILAHNYQLPEVQQVADYLGDSLYLSQVAASIESEVIVFCGVRFMAETAHILSPQKTVLLPESEALCPLADMITEEQLREFKAKHEGIPVVCYINSSAEIKAESDVCCTSANAVKVLSAISEQKIMFVPDKNLGGYIASQLPEKEILLWPGFCPTHAKVQASEVQKIRELYPQAKLLVHPECDPSVVDLADFAGSTSAIIRYAEQSNCQEFLIGTEMGVLHKLQSDLPNKRFFLLHPGLVCPNMKKTHLESIYESLQQGKEEIKVNPAVASKARRSLQRMLEVV